MPATKTSNCRSCGAVIVFLKTRRGKFNPVNLEPTEDSFRPPHADETDFVYGEHQSHFQTCPSAEDHRK